MEEIIGQNFDYTDEEYEQAVTEQFGEEMEMDADEYAQPMARCK